MELAAAITLIEKGIATTPHPQRWADLGAGAGLFTRALASLLKKGSTIYAVDKEAYDEIAPATGVTIQRITQDFIAENINLSGLDGIILANALHFVRDKLPFIRYIRSLLKEHGRLVIIEYERETGNEWVPYPITYNDLEALAHSAGFQHIEKIGSHASRYHEGGMYAMSLK